MENSIRRLCVFCGSNLGFSSRYQSGARGLALQIVSRRWGLVYGGTSVGLMGVVANTVLAEGGQVTGVLPSMLAVPELQHAGVSDMRIVPSMHARKALMSELSDAFVALPGGYGTFEELLEIITWTQLGIHRKPIGLLNTDGFYQPLLDLIDHSVREGFIRAEQRHLLVADDDPAKLLDRLTTHRMPVVPKWVKPEET